MIREAIKIVEKLYSTGVYISLKLAPESKEVFNEYLKDNIPDLTPTPDPHLTLIYSKKKYDGEIKTEEYSVSGLVTGFDIFGTDELALVAKIDSQDIIDRNETLVKKYGFVSDFDEYRPHITLAYGIDADFDLSSLPKFPSELIFEDETAELLNKDWVK